MPLKQTKHGATNLHLWRTGITYEQQKGAMYRREWNNVYLHPFPAPSSQKDIIYCDLRHAMPFPDNSFDAVYALHIIEHLTPKEGVNFLKDARRVLKPGGIVRLSTPDLENIVRTYLTRLQEAATSPSARNILRHRWAMIELIDQMCRDSSGGEMSKAIAWGEFDLEYGKERYGDVFDEFYIPSERERPGILAPPALMERILKKIGRMMRQPFSRNQVSREEILSDPWRSFEINKWTYDRLSLGRALVESGFKNILQKPFDQSDIPHWDEYQFDCSTKGNHPIEPSLYMEARK